MKRDMDLIRLLLLEITGEEVDFSGYTSDVIRYHQWLLIDAKLAEGNVTWIHGHVVAASISRLTWSGHDFLETIKSEDVWQKTRNTVIEKGVGTPFEVLKQLATKVTMEILLS